MSDQNKPDWFHGVIKNDNPDLSPPINGKYNATHGGPYHWRDIIDNPDFLETHQFKRAVNDTITWRDIVCQNILSREKWCRFKNKKQQEDFQELVSDYLINKIFVLRRRRIEKQIPVQRDPTPMSWYQVAYPDKSQEDIRKIRHKHEEAKKLSAKKTTLIRLLKLEKKPLLQELEKTVIKDFDLALKVILLRRQELSDDEIETILSKMT